MAIDRQKLIHFHGAGAVTAATTLTEKGFVKGEIAVRHGADAENSELYILDNTGALVSFASAAKVGKDIAAAVKVEEEARIAAVSGVSAEVVRVEGEYKTAISGVTEAYKAADDVVRGEFAAADTALENKITSAYTAADAAIEKTIEDMNTDLQGQLDAIVEEIGLTADEVNGPTGLHADIAAAVQAAATAESNAKTHAENQVKALAEGAVSANTAAIAAEVKRAGEAEVALGERITAEENARKAAVSGLTDMIAAAGAAATTKVVEGTDNSHLAITDATAEDGSVTYTITLTDVASDSEFKTVKAAVETLVGSDANMSARAIVQDEVTKQLTSENISESFDTLKEMAEWLSSHPQDVTEMNEAIEALENKVGAGVSGTTLTAEIARVESEYKAKDVLIDKAIEDMDAAYKAADSALETKITSAYTAADSALETKITSAYTAADSALETKITSAYTAADAILQEAINTVSKAVEDEVEARKTAISGVTTAYEAADAILRQAIADEETARKAAVSGVTDEIARVEREYKAADKGITDRLAILEGNSTATAVQEVVVSNLTGVEAVKSGTTVTIDYKNMVIDCGSWE